MSECRNPECRNKFTPGVVGAGKGSAKVPIVGATMHWGWVNCLACNMSEAQAKAGAQYKHVNRSPAQIAERARMADAKAPYVPEAQTATHGLASIKVAAGPAPSPTAHPLNGGMVEKLMGQIEKLTDQVTKLLDENRELRSRIDAQGSPAPAAVVKKKGGSRASSNSLKGKRSLS